MSIEWSDDLATGMATIDDQHRELYANVAKLHAIMKERRLDDLPAVLDFLQRYALEHFATEEREMEKAGYPGLGDHQAAHQAFVSEYLRHRDHLRVGPTTGSVIALSAWLGGWLREHVRRVDGEMARYLRPLGARSAGSEAPKDAAHRTA